MDEPTTRSTLSSAIVSKLKEQKPIEGSGILLEERQELLSSVEPELAVLRKLKRTKGGTSRVERSSTNRTRSKVMWVTNPQKEIPETKEKLFVPIFQYFVFFSGQRAKIVIFRASVPVKSNLMVNFASLSLLLDKNKRDGWYSVILCCPLVSFYLCFISKAWFPRYNKKSQPHSPSESVVYPKNGRHATLSRSTFVSRNKCQATRLLVQKLLSHNF